MPNISKYALLPFGLLIDSDEINWPLLAPDGTAGAPSYSFASEPTSGLYRSVNGIYIARDSGNQYVRVDDPIVFWNQPGGTGAYTFANLHDTYFSFTAVDAAGVGIGSVTSTAAGGNLSASTSASLESYGFYTDFANKRLRIQAQDGTPTLVNTFDVYQTYTETSADIFPSTNGSLDSGRLANPWKDTYTNGLLVGRAAKTTTYTVAAGDSLISADATSGAFTVNLPAAASHTGRVIYIKKTDSSANAVTIDANASEEIDGETTLDLVIEGDCAMLICNGTGWEIV